MKSLRQLIVAIMIATLWIAVAGVFTSAVAVPLPGGTLDPLSIPKYVTPLVIPPVMPETATTIGAPGTENYNIAVRQFKQQILPGGIWNVATGVAAGTLTYPPTTVWSYGNAQDPMPDSSTGGLGGGIGVAPAPNSSFNYPAFTVENTSGVMSKVRWINELVQDPVACFYGNANGNSCNYLTHLLDVDQTLHWTNPGNSDCYTTPGAPTVNGTDCETHNQLPYMGPVPIIVHVHGAHVNPQSDGYPEAWWLPNADNIPGTYVSKGTHYGEWANAANDGVNDVPGSAFFGYENTQEATTLWYHDHSLGMTRLNVYAGPAGFWLIRGGLHGDAYVDNVGTATALDGKLPGPAPVAGDATIPLNVVGNAKRVSIREIPIAIQDRSFDWVDASGNVVPQGDPSAVGTELWYPSSRVDFDGYNGPYLGDPTGDNPSADINAIWNPEAFFNTFVVNGVTWPKLDVAQERYRFRLLNGCNSRTVNLFMEVVSSSNAALVGTEIPFYQIGGDQGFLPAVTMIKSGVMAQLTPGQAIPNPVPATGDIQAMLLMPAERADVIVDFTGIPDGTRIRVRNNAGDNPYGGLDPDPTTWADPATTGQVMEFVVNAAINTGNDTSTPVNNIQLPADVPLGPSINAASPRKLSLNELVSETTCIAVDSVTGDFIEFLYTSPNLANNPQALQFCVDAGVASGAGRTGDLAGPRMALLGQVQEEGAGVMSALPRRWMDPIVTNPLINTTETWELYNVTADAHPIHVHLVRFEILDRENIAVDADGLFTLAGGNTPPLANELGFKDTVVAYPGQVTRLKAKFDIAGLYVWHCHIVEHEDNEMMLPFEVLPNAAPAAPASITVPATANGTYTVSWDGALSTTYPSVTYTLEESTDPAFLAANTTVAVAGTTLNSATITKALNGTFYYRVKAVIPAYVDSAWTTGANGVVVTAITGIATNALPPAVTNTPYSYTMSLAAGAGSGDYTWSSYGLPVGFTLDAITGVIATDAGYPNADNLRTGQTVATYPVSIFVLDNVTNVSDGTVMILNVAVPAVP